MFSLLWILPRWGIEFNRISGKIPFTGEAKRLYRKTAGKSAAHFAGAWFCGKVKETGNHRIQEELKYDNRTDRVFCRSGGNRELFKSGNASVYQSADRQPADQITGK
jgi:hypothetical protein